MAKFHINGKGEPGACKATSGNCPFGEIEDHFDSPEAARAAYERSMANHPAGKGRKQTSSSLAVYGSLTETTRAKIAKAQELFDKSEKKMNDTAMYENYGPSTREGSDRILAVVAHEKATARLAKVKRILGELKQIHGAVERLDKGTPLTPGSHYSGSRRPITFAEVNVGDVIETRPMPTAQPGGGVKYNRNRGLVIGKTDAGKLKVIYEEVEDTNSSGEFVIPEEKPFEFSPSETERPKIWLGRHVASIIDPE